MSDTPRHTSSRLGLAHTVSTRTSLARPPRVSYFTPSRWLFMKQRWSMANPVEEIGALVDAETAAWNARDADALVSLFHPDTVWPWPPNAAAHDPMEWVVPFGRFNRERWKSSWQSLFDTHELLHNVRKTLRIVVSDQGDGAFAVVDVDTLWRDRATGQPVHWKGRACKVYTKVDERWLFLFQTGLLEYKKNQATNPDERT